MTMTNTKQIIMVVLLILNVHCCPKACETCNEAKTVCLSCSQGYELNSKTQLCDLSYNRQPQWPGDCNSGRRQTPINIDTTNNLICPSNTQFYQDTATSLINTQPKGNDLTATYIGQSTVTYFRVNRAQTFDSLQFHWHAPSQHTVNGQYFDLELHIVHINRNGSGNLAVTGLFFNLDKDAKSDILDKYNFMASDTDKQFMFPMLLKNKSVYHYMGSLTTPPCAEIVTWFVYTEAFPLTKRNFDAIKQQINGGSSNSRTVQNLNVRNVELVGGFCNPMIKKA